MDSVVPTNGTSNTTSAADVMAKWFTVSFADGVSELTSLLLSQLNPSVVPCGNDVVVLTKSTAVAGNGVCPNGWPGMSCTCVTQSANGSAPPNEWVFRVTPIAKAPRKTAAALSLDASASVLEVSTIGQFVLPSTITAFRLLGVASDGNALEFDFDLGSIFPSDTTISLVMSGSKNYVQEVEIANIDFSAVSITDTFLPPSVAQVTMRNCGIETLPSPFLFLRWDKLATIDLSYNKLAHWYDGEVADIMPSTPCTIETLNLAGNAFASIPPSLLTMNALQSLNFSYNPVANFTVGSALFDHLAKLTTLSFDGIDTASVTAESCNATANGSTVKSAHGVNFCVVSDEATTAASAGTASSSGHTIAYITTGSGIAIVVVMVALFVFYKRRRRKHPTAMRPKAFSRTFENQNDSRSEHHRGLETLSARNSLSLSIHELSALPIDMRLLNDPMLITSRLDQRDVRLGELLKRGGFGVVYSGVYRRRRVAIKMLRNDFTNDTKLLESFLKEIALMASLTHPRIVEYIGCVWDTVQNIAVVTELMDRGDLREVLQHYKTARSSPLTWVSHKTRLALHIAEGLEYLHTLTPKVIHRDLKSKNVLVNTDLDAKLTDFGISREGRFEQTHMTAGIGTSFWIAPEVLAGLRYDERADIFSFGVVLSEIDTDDYPYWNNEHGSGQGDVGVDVILRRVLGGELKPRFTPECPQMIRALADRCLATEPSMRVSASEIVQYLSPIANATAEMREKYLALTAY